MPKQTPDKDLVHPREVSGKMTALMVHVNQEMLEMMRSVLEAKGLEVLESKNPTEALLQIEKACPDIVIHNYQMPQMDGMVFDRKIRKKYGSKKPAIVWTSLIPIKPAHVTGCGISAWIKPFFEPTEFSYFMDEVLKDIPKH